MLKPLSTVALSKAAALPKATPECAGATATCLFNCSTTSRAESEIWPGSLCQADETWVRMDPKPGWPPRFSGGKYVPPKKGSRPGVSQTDIGQPPLPVVACTNVM